MSILLLAIVNIRINADLLNQIINEQILEFKQHLLRNEMVEVDVFVLVTSMLVNKLVKLGVVVREGKN